MDQQCITTRHLTRIFGPIQAVRDVSLDIGMGTRYALVGKNGAGKTTLLKMLVGLIAPTSGHAEICGYDISVHPVEAKSHFGYVPDNPAGYEYLTGFEFLEFTGNLRGMDADSIRKRTGALSAVFPMADVLGSRIGSYSRGNRQKVSILSAFMSGPELLIIDEPIVGLDPESIGILGRLISAHCKDGGSVLFVTHILPFAAAYADTVGLMDHGVLKEEQPVRQRKLPSHIVREVEASV
jgi:ABC-2 type transport system ATP-binding protein